MPSLTQVHRIPIFIFLLVKGLDPKETKLTEKLARNSVKKKRKLECEISSVGRLRDDGRRTVLSKRCNLGPINART